MGCVGELSGWVTLGEGDRTRGEGSVERGGKTTGGVLTKDNGTVDQGVVIGVIISLVEELIEVDIPLV